MTNIPIYSFLQKTKRLFIVILYKFFSLRKIDNNKIVLYSPSNNELKGNLLFIYKSIKRKKVYCFFKTKNILKFIYHVATSKIVITDDYSPILYPINFRKQTKFIQVWHASGMFKNVGFKRLGKIGGPNKNSITHKNYTDVIVSSTNIIDEYSQTFMLEKSKFKPLGTPRTDMYFDKVLLSNLKKEFNRKYPMCKNKKIILYAPTFRGNGIKSAYFTTDINFNKLCKFIGKEYIILFKNHPFVNNYICSNKFIIDISHETDVNTILPFVDILITDYSSIIFDAVLLNKKTIFYVPDLEEYQNSRGIYYELEHYNFGIITKNIDELIEAIKNPIFNLKKANEIKEKHLNMCDGKSTERFIQTYIK